LKEGGKNLNTRRVFLRGSIAATAMATVLAAIESPDANAAAADEKTAPAPAALPPAKYTLSVNLEMMFPRAMPWEERLEIAGREGAKAYSFWAFANKDLDKLRAVQDKYGMACGSITGANKTGWGAGLTRTGQEKAFLDDFGEACAAAKKVGAENLITFVGVEQKDIPWETQMEQIVAGLKKAGDIAGEAGVYLTLEPLNAVESPKMAMVTSGRAYEITERVAHSRVKVDFDLYHRQLGEGNLINTMKNGLEKGYVRFVEVGDVPGRMEPGTGEVDYARLFRVLREVGYAGYIGMEHRASTTPQEAIRAVRRLAGV
jgi:hydroxypyruvate isomerase